MTSHASQHGSAFVYRYSARGGVDGDRSMRRQQAVCDRLAKDRNLAVVHDFGDIGCSGSSLDRPGIQRMLVSVDRVRPEFIVVEDLSRLSRNLRDFTVLQVALAAFGAAVLTASDEITELRTAV